MTTSSSVPTPVAASKLVGSVMDLMTAVIGLMSGTAVSYVSFSIALSFCCSIIPCNLYRSNGNSLPFHQLLLSVSCRFVICREYYNSTCRFHNKNTEIYNFTQIRECDVAENYRYGSEVASACSNRDYILKGYEICLFYS